MNSYTSSSLLSRQEAGWQLGEQLQNRYLDSGNNLVMALPTGGVVVGAMVARTLNCPMDVMLLENLHHPMNQDLEVGVVSLNSRVYDMLGKSSTDLLDDQTQQLRTILKEKRSHYNVPQGADQIEGKHVFLVDDGCTDEGTFAKAIALLRSQGAWGVTVVTPMATTEAVTTLSRVANSVCTNELVRSRPNLHQLSYLMEELKESEVLEWLEKGNDFQI